MNRLTSFVLIPAAVSLLVICAVTAWLQVTILNEDHFASTVSAAMAKDSSRNAVATLVVDRTLQNRPLLQAAVRDPAQGAISGVLGTSLFRTPLNTAARLVWRDIFIRGGGDVTLNLVQAKRILSGVFGLADASNATRVDPSDVPDQVVIFKGGQLPDLRWMHDVAPWVLWISGIAGIALLAFTFWRAATRRHRVRILRVSGIVLAIEAAGIMLLILFGRALLVSNVKTDSGRVIIKEFSRSFIGSLVGELLILALIGFVLIAASLWLTEPQTVPVSTPSQTGPGPFDELRPAPGADTPLPS
jgi:hypothetical protein